MDRETLIRNLTGKIDNATYDRIEELYPLAKVCPTCDGQLNYTLDNAMVECDCEIQKLLQRHYFAANIGREYHDICLTHFEGPDAELVVPVVTEYINNWEDNFHFGLGLTFTGPIGTGKTFAMTCVLKELIKRGGKAYFITFDDLVNVWGQSYQDESSKRLLEKRLKTVEVLGLDELRSDGRNHSGFLSNALDSVIRHRTANLLPTLVTTNLTPQQESSEFLKAYSLLAAKNTRVTTQGHDRRKREVRERNITLAKRGERRPIC